MGRYLIVGAAGYTGSRLAAHLLSHGHYVRGLVRSTDSDVVQRLAQQGMSVWEGDVTHPESLIGVAHSIEYVYNLTSRMVIENGSVRRVAVEGNQNLIAACSRARTVQAYVFTSNISPYGSRGDAWLTEDEPVSPEYPLGEVMIEAEQTIMELVRQHHFPAIILRVGFIYGPERDFIEAIASNTATMIGDGRNYMSRIHVDDLVPILDRVTQDGQPGALYNVADDAPTRAIDFYSVVRQRLGMVPPRERPADQVLFAGMDPSVVGMSAASVRLSNQRMKEELGIELRYPHFGAWVDEQLGEPVEELKALAVNG